MKLFSSFLSALLWISVNSSNAQEISKSAFTVPAELKENANSCARLNKLDIQVKSQRQMTIKKHQVVTIFNERGHNSHDWGEAYNANIRVNNIEVTIYNASGGVDRKFKKKDFRDFSVSDGFSVANDIRSLELNFTPTSYPYTIEYKSEVVSDNTAFMPTWYLYERFFKSIEETSFEMSFPEDLGFRYQLYNFDEFKDEVKVTNTSLKVHLKNLSALKPETNMPAFKTVFPQIKMSLSKFHLAGVDGEAKTWEEFGVWMNDKLLAGTDELPEVTKALIRKEVEGIDDPLEKVKKVYQFVQNKTRYVSIQLGIGGWKPMLAKDVDRLGYGDCKALTNYTRALLKEVGVEAYYTIIYLDDDIRNIEPDFVSMQGNHAILAIPMNGTYIWAECTSQTSPINYQAFATDNRTALIITPTGGKIIETNKYVNDDNLKFTNATVHLTPDGNITAEVNIKTSGNQMYRRMKLTRANETQKQEFYKEKFNAPNGVKLAKMDILLNDKELYVNESLELSSVNTVSKAGKRMMVTPNWFTDLLSVPSKYRDRKYPVYVDRGYLDEELVNISIPEGYQVEALPNPIFEQSPFGVYSLEYKLIDNKLQMHRKLQMKEGTHPKEQFDAYRQFVEKIVRNDNSKVVLIEI